MTSVENRLFGWSHRKVLALIWVVVLTGSTVALVGSTGFVGHHFVGFRPTIGCIVPGPRSDRWPRDFHFGDQIAYVDGHGMADRAALVAYYDQLPVGRLATHRLLRQGRPLIVVARVQPFTWSDWWESGAPFLVLALGAVVLGLFVSWRAPDHAEARVFAYACAALAIAAVLNGTVDLWPPLFGLYALAPPLMACTFILLGARLSGDQRPIRWPFVVSLLLAIIGYAALPTQGVAVRSAASLSRAWQIWFVAVLYWPLIACLTFLGHMVRSLLRAPRGSLAWTQTRVIVWGALIAFLPPTLIWSWPLIGGAFYPTLATLSLFAFLAFPGTMAVAVLRYRLFEIEILLRRTLVYGLYAGALAVAYFGSVAGLTQFLGVGRSEEARLGLFLVTLLVAAPLRNGLKRGLDRLFDRERMAPIELQRRLLRGATDPQSEARAFARVAADVADALKLTGCAVATVNDGVLSVGPGHTPLAASAWALTALPMASRWDRRSHPDFAWPEGIEGALKVMQGDQLVAVLFLGEKRSQEVLSEADYDYLGLVLGQIGLILSYTQGLRQQTAVEREMASLLAQVKKLNDLQAQFGIVTGHELRTPLTVIRSHAEALLDGLHGALTEEQRSSLQLVHTGAQALTRRVSDYLHFVAFKAGKLRLERRPMSLAGVMAEVVELTRASFTAKSLVLNLEASGGLRVEADPRRLRQALVLLMEETVQLAAAGGLVSFTAARESGHIELWVGCEGHAQELAALLTLLGDGSDRRHGELLTEPGLRTQLARGLIEAMGASVSARRRGERQVGFLILLPLRPPPPGETPPQQREVPPPHGAEQRQDSRGPAVADRGAER